MIDINCKPIIFGTGLSSCKDYQGLLSCCTTAVENGIRWFDTAPSYRTEETLGSVINEILKTKIVNREELLIQTKIDPIQMYESKVEHHVEETLRSFKIDYFDVLLIHWPVYKYVLQTWKVLESLKKRGLTRKIGICNLRISHLNELKGIGVIPDVLQIERHPLNTFTDECQFCVDNKILLQDYSPLCKMHPLLSKNEKLQKIADNHSCGIGEIILCWHIQTGAIPIFTSTKTSRIVTYSKLDNIQLTDSEIATITNMNINFKLYLESLICPGY